MAVRLSREGLTMLDKLLGMLRGDATVQYQDLMEVFDALKAAGVENVGMVAALPGER